MIELITFETAHLFGDALVSQHRLRYRAFIERQGWEVPYFKQMEYDQYDTPATVYLVWRDHTGEVRGTSRLNPTDRPYMLKDIWPEMVTQCKLPSSSHILEGSRFCVDKDLDEDTRRKVVMELVCAYLEYSLQYNITDIIGVMPPLIWRFVFCRSGWPVDFVGTEKQLDNGDKIIAGLLNVSSEILINVKKKLGINESILQYTPVLSLNKHKEIA